MMLSDLVPLCIPVLYSSTRFDELTLLWSYLELLFKNLYSSAHFCLWKR